MDKQTESREQFEKLCNEFWNWQEHDEITQGEEEPCLRWDGKNYTHRVTAALWRMFNASRESLVVETDSHTILTHTTPAIPPGYKLVPVEPTFQICEILGCKWEAGEGFPARWASMLAETNGEVI